MTTTELEAIADEIRTGYQLRSERIGAHVKLLRSIEISALREALELVQGNFVQGIDHLRITHIKAEAITSLEAKIRTLELK